MLAARKLIALAALSGLLVLAARSAEAQAQRRIYLNGVDLTDTEVKNQEFVSCKVRFDDKGNLHITAPGLEIKKKPAAKEPPVKEAKQPSPSKVTRSYYLVSKENRRGATHYDVAVYINGKRVTTIRSNAGPAAMDITRFVKPGTNQVRLFATKRKGEKSGHRGAGANAAEAYLEIQVGEGRAKDDTVTLTKTLLQYKRSAAESKTYDHTYRFTSR